jgi:cellulose 1,4-beta-cellobiosidase
VDPQWQARAAAEPGGEQVADQPTAVWLDSVGAVHGTDDRMGLRAHLDAALAQGAGYIQFVLYNLPGRDCWRLVSDGELAADDLDAYRTGYLDPIAATFADPRYAELRIVTLVEVRALPSLITRTAPRATATPACNQMRANGNYVLGVRHALNRLQAIPNVYTYLDVANHAWTGPDDSFGPIAQLVADTVRGTTRGLAGLDGFITNTADYAALSEPYLNADEQARLSRWAAGNPYHDELTFAVAFRRKLVELGFPASIGALIDTSRNGWGGPDRPTAASVDPDLDARVDASRVDRRASKENWCNQVGAGLGERPRAYPARGIDAYVWATAPGVSDGSPTPESIRGFNPMCDPTYLGNLANGYRPSGARPGGLERGQWFAAHFRELLANAYPPVDAGSPSP